MSETINSGPLISAGPLMGNMLTQAGAVVDDGSGYAGPNIFYQADALPDPRYQILSKDSLAQGRVPSFYNNPSIAIVDNVPSLHSTTGLAGTQHIVAGTALTLATTGVTTGTVGYPQIAVSIPLLPFQGSGANVGSTLLGPLAWNSSGALVQNTGTPVNVSAIDFGFTTGVTTTGATSTTITVADSSIFKNGQWIVVAGAGNSGKTKPLITQITAIPTITTITVSVGASSAMTAAPIASANCYTQFPAQAVANAANPFVGAGVAQIFNPAEAISRCVSITASNASAPTNVFTVLGYDIYGVPMSENITVTPGTALTTWGNKAFKYIYSITPNTTTDATYNWSAGVGDTFGFALRSDKWEFTTEFWNGVAVPTNVGWTAADASNSTSTATTQDVRGSITVSASSNLTPITAASASDGAKRLAVFITLTNYNILRANPSSSISLFGVPQF